MILFIPGMSDYFFSFGWCIESRDTPYDWRDFCQFRHCLVTWIEAPVVSAIAISGLIIPGFAIHLVVAWWTLITKFMGSTWGSCGPQVGPIVGPRNLAIWDILTEYGHRWLRMDYPLFCTTTIFYWHWWFIITVKTSVKHPQTNGKYDKPYTIMPASKI